MRVLVFLPCFTHGGAEKQGAILARYLTQKGHDVEVWGFPTLGPESPLLSELKNDGIKCRELSEWPKFNWDFTRHGRYLRYLEQRFIKWPRQIKNFEKTIPTANFDVVVPFTNIPSLVSVLCSRVIRSNRILWNYRGGYDDAGFKFTNYIVRQIKRKKPVMIANSTAGAKFLADRFVLSPHEVSVIHNVFLPDESLSRLAFERRCHFSAVLPLQLLHVANLFPEKDIWTVLNAIELLKSSGYLCHLHVAGFFPNASDYKVFVNKIQANELNHMVTYHGAVSKQQLQSLLLKADIGILSSRSEGLPNSVMEYMYTRLPVIGTDIPGIREIVSNDNADWLFDYGNAEHLAELIVKLGKDVETRQALGEANRLKIIENFSLEYLMPKWEKALGTV